MIPYRIASRTALLALFFFLGTAYHVLATPPQGDAPQQDLFASEALLEFTLTGDLSPIYRDTSDDRPYRPARLWYLDEAGDTVSLDMGLKTRGYYRRKFLDCDVPPLRLNFKKKQVKNTVFDGQDKLKLVTHCRDKIDLYEQYTLQEYMIYKTYNLLTNNSFRVRLVRVTYEDTENKRDAIMKYGFLIEDEDALAERLGGRNLETGVIHQERTNKEQATMLALFQFMVGNTDWSVPAHHNIKFVFMGPQIPPLTVPYDFDMAGIIHTQYAKPDPRLGIRSVRERLYRGYCRTDEEFATTFALFQEQQEVIYASYRDFPYLKEKYKERALKYLDEFYETIISERRIKREILAACLTE